jgi:5'-3' exonuclease
MGIRGLKKYLDFKNMNREINWSDYEHKTIAIDIQSFLYKARSEDKNPFEVIGSFLFELLSQNTQVFIVFDGKAPKEKSTIMTARKEERREAKSTIELITKDIDSGIVPDKDLAIATIKQLKSKTPTLKYDDAKNMKKFCYTMGFTYYQANGEADNFLAYLSHNNLVDAIISPDMDLLARGVKNLIVPESNIPELNNKWKIYNLDIILSMMKFSYDQFVMFCVMLGCDYTYGIQNVPVKFAYDAIKVHKALDKAYEAIGGDNKNIEILLKAYNLLGYSDRNIEDLLGMGSVERFSSKTFLIPETEHIDELEISDDLKAKYKIKLEELCIDE